MIVDYFYKYWISVRSSYVCDVLKINEERK